MNFKDLTPELLPTDKLPHLKFNLKSIDTLQNLIELLNARKEIITKELSDTNTDKSEYDLNERKIMLIKTDMELSTNHANIYKKQTYIDDLKNNYINVLKEMAEKWNEIYELAVSKKDGNKNLEEELAKYNLEFFNENWEYAVNFYLNLKSILFPPPEETKKLKKV
jgi:hypothetical protein